jgi:hypothetical protein
MVLVLPYIWLPNLLNCPICLLLLVSFVEYSTHSLLFLVNDQRDAKFFSMYLFLFSTLYMFRAYRSHRQERRIERLVAVTLCRWPCRVQVRPAHDTEWQLPEVVLTQFFSPDDEHDALETCRVKNKYTEKNCASRWSFTKNHYTMHGQQNVKLYMILYKHTNFRNTYQWL